MPRDRIYLDYNATAPLRPAARACMIEVLERCGNPSSIHTEGRRARAAVEEARSAVAALFGATPDGVTFTSGATEAAALALTPDLSDVVDRSPAARLLVGATEHPAVLQGHRFAADRVERIAVRPDGTLDLAALTLSLDRADGRSILALQAANGETGVIQPVAEAAALMHARGGLLVCDVAQAAGRIDCRFETLGADVVLVSAHKLGGPQGAGAVVLGRPSLGISSAVVRGGGQERGLRGGTENVAALAGFGRAAFEAASLRDTPRLAALREKVEQRLKALLPDRVIFGEDAARLPNTIAFAVPGFANETLLIGLDLEGIAVSTGSACSSGKVSSSHVLEAMGVAPHLRRGMIRVSLGWASTDKDIDRLLEAVGTVVGRMGARDRRSAA